MKGQIPHGSPAASKGLTERRSIAAAMQGTPVSPCVGSKQRFQLLLIVIALCALTLLAYSNSFGAGFVLDNRGLLQDPRIRAATAENVALIFQHTYWWPLGEAGLYRPLTTLSYLFNYAILGDADRAAGYHWLNLVLHSANVLLVLALALRLFRQMWPSGLLAGLWAVHPASTESVTNIIGRSDLLAALAMLGGLLMYVKSRETAGWRRMACLLGLGLITAIGVLSKESAVMIIGLMALYELVWPGRRRWRDLLFGCIATGVPIIAMLTARAAVLAGSSPTEFPFTDNPIASADFWTGRLTALKVIAQYLAPTVWPLRLSIDYSYSQIPLVNGSATDWAAIAVIVAAAAGLAALYRWNRTASFLAGFAVLVFLPTSNLLFPIGTIRADRFLYLPGVGLLGCLMIGIHAAASRLQAPWVGRLVLCIIVAGFAVRTWARNAEWSDEFTLASADVQASPNSFKLHRLMATAMYAADSSHFNIDRVVDEIDKSLAILDPLADARNAPETYQFAGTAYLVKGDRLEVAGSPEAVGVYQRARELLERCIAINKAYEQQFVSKYGKPRPGVVARTEPEAYRLLAVADQRLGDMDGALRAAREARVMAPQDPRMYSQIADLLLLRNEGDAAARILMEGMLITADMRLRTELVRLYGSSNDSANCTLVAGPNGPAINPRCDIVRDHMCAAAPNVLKSLIASGHREEAAQKKQAFVRDYQCAGPPLDAVLQ